MRKGIDPPLPQDGTEVSWAVVFPRLLFTFTQKSSLLGKFILQRFYCKRDTQFHKEVLI